MCDCVWAPCRAGCVEVRVISSNLKLFSQKRVWPFKSRILRVPLTIKACGILPRGAGGKGLSGRTDALSRVDIPSECSVKCLGSPLGFGRGGCAVACNFIPLVQLLLY